MSVNPANASGGGTDPASGGDEPQNKPIPNEGLPVSYETHRKLLGEKKKLHEETEVLRAEKKSREEKELREKGEYEALLKRKDDELAKTNSEKFALIAEKEGNLKFTALMDAIGGNLDRIFWPLLNLDGIKMDPNTGQPEATSVQDIAKSFKATYAKIIVKGTGVGVSNDSASRNETCSADDYNKLQGSKEKRKKLAEAVRIYQETGKR